ncbi:carboxypeptidase [Bifidobacterium goeldii]|uniref:Carboxypeptidase n=2 Tax=Bifidobacterium goeldii TaxID=2306975 RepID=A0A430FKJ6_9BIFI|nr:carboxypeptidase [Bifidobacterium goeldii]
MATMPKKKSLTVKRVFSLFLAYMTLCLAGGVVTSLFFLPAVLGANTVVKAVVPSLQVEGINFSVTDLPQQSRLYAADGTTQLTTFYSQNRIVVPLKKISEPMRNAMVAREDRRFFEHSGVDVQGVLRAFVQTYVKKGSQQGGSSLTQQYVKNVLILQAEESDDPIAEYHASEDTIARKMREMLIAVEMEKQYSKLEILQGYLNIAQYGRGIYGVEMAARRYFNTTADKLTIVQAATIAAITKNPNNYDPSVESNQPESQKQRNIVLDLMLQEGYITQKEHDEAKATPIADTLNVQTVSAGCSAAGDAAYFCDYVTKKILNSSEFGKDAATRRKLLYEGGLDIYTTMDVAANTAAMNAARNAIPADDASQFEVMLAAIRPGTGEVLGFGINKIYDTSPEATGDPSKSAMNYAVDEIDGGGTGFPVGSTWKPINLVAWMRAGKSINEVLPATTSVNLARDIPGFKGVNTWQVQNAGGDRATAESPLDGLVHSHNTTQAAMLKVIGLSPIAQAAEDMGFHQASIQKMNMKLQDDTSTGGAYQAPLVIGGTVTTSPLTMANVYATIAANGVECTPIAIKKITDATGKELTVPKAKCHQAVDPEIAQTVAYALNQFVVRSDGGGHAAQLANNRKTFAKTGTNENTYMLTGGFVPTVAAFVAVGNADGNSDFDNKTINGVYHNTWYGSYIATPTWKNFMDDYLTATNTPNDDSYGTPSDKYMTVSYSYSKSNTGSTSGTSGSGSSTSTQTGGTATDQSGTAGTTGTTGATGGETVTTPSQGGESQTQTEGQTTGGQ